MKPMIFVYRHYQYRTIGSVRLASQYLQCTYVPYAEMEFVCIRHIL